MIFISVSTGGHERIINTCNPFCFFIPWFFSLQMRACKTDKMSYFSLRLVIGVPWSPWRINQSSSCHPVCFTLYAASSKLVSNEKTGRTEEISIVVQSFYFLATHKLMARKYLSFGFSWESRESKKVVLEMSIRPCVRVCVREGVSVRFLFLLQ